MSDSQQVEQKVVKMANGELKNFGERGKLLSSHVITENSLTITFHIVTGEQVVFTHEVSGLDTLTAEAAIFGFASKTKASTAGTPVEKIKEVIEGKIAEYKAGIWASRGTPGESLTPLTQIQTAYAIVNNIDPYTNEGIAHVNAHFATLSKEERSKLYSIPAIKIELAKLRLAAAEAIASK